MGTVVGFLAGRRGLHTCRVGHLYQMVTSECLRTGFYGYSCSPPSPGASDDAVAFAGAIKECLSVDNGC
jgi:hypothetical protein